VCAQALKYRIGKKTLFAALRGLHLYAGGARVVNSARRSGFATGSARSITASTTAKMAVFAPMPTASDRTATSKKPGLFESVRKA
jgi:hypothetical protein